MTADDVLLAALTSYRRRGGNLMRIVELWVAMFGGGLVG